MFYEHLMTMDDSTMTKKSCNIILERKFSNLWIERIKTYLTELGPWGKDTQDRNRYRKSVSELKAFREAKQTKQKLTKQKTEQKLTAEHLTIVQLCKRNCYANESQIKKKIGSMDIKMFTELADYIDEANPLLPTLRIYSPLEPYNETCLRQILFPLYNHVPFSLQISVLNSN